MTTQNIDMQKVRKFILLREWRSGHMMDCEGEYTCSIGKLIRLFGLFGLGNNLKIPETRTICLWADPLPDERIRCFLEFRWEDLDEE